jgi:hypothetical protein
MLIVLRVWVLPSRRVKKWSACQGSESVVDSRPSVRRAIGQLFPRRRLLSGIGVLGIFVRKCAAAW